MSAYSGTREKDGTLTVTVDGRLLDPRLDLRDHSPTGFECSYGGSGPAQLALAILAHHFQDPGLALGFYQQFKWDVISKLPKGDWTLTSDNIVDTCIPF